MKIEILTDPSEIALADKEGEARLTRMGHPAEWGRSGIGYENEFLVVHRDPVRFPDGALGTYLRIAARDGTTPGVIALPIYQGRIILLDHYRHATASSHLEIPRGFGEPGLTAAETIRMELSEEIEATGITLTDLGEFHVDSGIMNHRGALFLAHIESYGKPQIHEAISAIREVTIEEFEQWIGDGTITDSFTLVAFARARARGLL